MRVSLLTFDHLAVLLHIGVSHKLVHVRHIAAIDVDSVAVGVDDLVAVDVDQIRRRLVVVLCVAEDDGLLHASCRPQASTHRRVDEVRLSRQLLRAAHVTATRQVESFGLLTASCGGCGSLLRRVPIR